MEQSRLPQSIVGATISFVSASAGGISWVIAHGPTAISVFGALVAIIAGLYSIRASKDTSILRKKQLQKLEDE